MKKGLLLTSLSLIFIFTLLVVSISFVSFSIEPYIIINEDSITLYGGSNATEEESSFQFTLSTEGMLASNYIWRLSDDTFLTVDQTGFVRFKVNIPKNIDNSSVILTVTDTISSNSDTAVIFIEMDPPLGSIIMTKSLFKDIYVEPTLYPSVVPAYKSTLLTKAMFKDIYIEPTLEPIIIPSFIDQVLKVPSNCYEFFIKYEEEFLE